MMLWYELMVRFDRGRGAEADAAELSVWEEEGAHEAAGWEGRE